MTAIDETHSPDLRCWIPSAENHPDFPIQNLPLGVFAPPGQEPRGGMAIGDFILDLSRLRQTGALRGDAARALEAAARPTLNAFLTLGPDPRRALRRGVSALLSDLAMERRLKGALFDAASCVMGLPATVGDYSDFYASLHHATRVGSLFRPQNPLLPNYKHAPIGYHGRASSLTASGCAVRRPSGQQAPVGSARPTFGPSRRLDFELEIGIWVGPGNAQGEPVPIQRARDHIAGLCLLNDWSARDIQAWEAQPLGPFLSKSFATTLSPWIVTPEALAPFQRAQAARPEGDPQPLPYLHDEEDQGAGAFDIELDARLTTERMRGEGAPAHRITRSNARHLYWTAAQLVAHHTSAGCNLRPGDLLGTGTISGPEDDAGGSLLELSFGGRAPLVLPNGETRCFLEDGDEIALSGRCERAGFRSIGFGDCRARVIAQ